MNKRIRTLQTKCNQQIMANRMTMDHNYAADFSTFAVCIVALMKLKMFKCEVIICDVTLIV